MKTEELTYIKRLELDQKHYLIFKDNNGITRLVNQAGYGAFVFKNGMKLKGVVRNRGCAGQEITEILHPEYKIGNEYIFIVVRISCITLNDSPVHIIIVADSKGTEFTIKLTNKPQFQINSKVLCRFQSQKKGRLTFLFKKVIIE